MTIKSVTYYSEDGVDYAVLALTLRQLGTVEAALDFALDRNNTVGAEAYDIRDEVMAGIERLEGREGRALQP